MPLLPLQSYPFLSSIFVFPYIAYSMHGHSSINMTLGTYGHLMPGLDEELTKRVDEVWTKTKY